MLEFLSTLNGQVYQTIQNILSEKKGLVIKAKGENDYQIFDADCDFFQTMEGIKITDGKYNYFYLYEEIRRVYEYV